MPKFIKVNSEIDILTKHINYDNKIVVDVGCGTGAISRFLASKAKFVTGIDIPELIQKAVSCSDIPDNLVFKPGVGQNLPLENNSADIIIFFASFHHIPANEMSAAIQECIRVLKKEGVVCFIEPYAMQESYYDLTRLLDDEAAIQKIALEKIKEAGETDFIPLHESFYFLERSLDHFLNQINIYVTDEKLKKNITDKAKEITAERNHKTGNSIYKSLCRENILKIRN